MASLKRLLGKHSSGHMKEQHRIEDLERGQEMPNLPTSEFYPTTPTRVFQPPTKRGFGEEGYPPGSPPRLGHCVPLEGRTKPLTSLPETHDYDKHIQSRTSNSDSEFSQFQTPVSPNRYWEALQVIEGSSPPPSPLLSRVSMLQHMVEEQDRNTAASECLPRPQETDISGDIYQPDSHQAAIQRLNEHPADLNPGSSQTSSSLSRGQSMVDRGRTNALQHSSSSSKLRSPTPPLLFGRRTKPSRTDRSFTIAGDMKSSEESEWESISDMKILGPGGDAKSGAQAGSSLADNSDSGDPSLDQVKLKSNSILARRPDQYPGAPRYHQAYMLVQDSSATGLTRNGLQPAPLQPRNKYRHPVPLSNHPNPFTTSPQFTQTFKSSQETTSDASSLEEKSFPNHDSKHSTLTDTFNELVRMHGSSSDMSDNLSGSNGEEQIMNKSEEGTLKKVTTESSAWTTAFTEDNSAAAGAISPSAMRAGSFARVTVLGRKGNITGTPEGTGAREVGSSLAGTSSPPALSDSQTPSSQQMQPNLLKTPELSSSPASRIQTSELGSRSKASRRRSSSESSCVVIPSPLRTNTSALHSPNFQLHRKRNTMAEIMSSGNSSFYGDEDSQDYQYQSSLRERHGHQAYTDRDDTSLSSAFTGHPAYANRAQASQISTSTESRAFLREGIVYTDVPRPSFAHPVYGVERPWDTPTLTRGRPQARSERFQRPIARVESPHLHRIPRPPTAAMRKHQEEVSNFWLTVFCIIPPIAPLFGHGAVDEIIRTQTEGEIEGFTETSKTIARYWGYGATSLICIAVLVTALLGGFDS